jgi:invasion protein IalB
VLTGAGGIDRGAPKPKRRLAATLLCAISSPASSLREGAVHQIARTTAGGSGFRQMATLMAVAFLALAPGSAPAQETGQPAAPTPGAQTPAPGGGQLGRTTTAPPPASEPGLEVRQFQDWAVRCGRPAEGAPEACEMVQQRLDEQGQTVLAVAVGKVPNAEIPGMLIILPLGIWLPPGVVLRVDGGEEISAEVARCERRGCQVELLLEPNVLTVLKSGREANVLFQIYDENGQPKVVGVPFSLLGFTAALDEVLA